MRRAISWALYWLGDRWCWVFDRDPIGLRGLLYKVYNGLMTAAYRVQGDGDGPWIKP
jgi:hypothetical protein